jgi:hypothetical protein
MRFGVFALILMLMIAPARARAQDTLAGVQGELSQLLGEMEGNLITRDGIEMSAKVWKSNSDALAARAAELQGRYDQANAYCQGTFEEAEYQRRLSYCTSLGSQLDALKAQMLPEFDNLEAQRQDLQRRDTERAAAWTALEGRFTPLLQRLVILCAAMTPAERATSCRLPPAPGPRTAPIVDQVNAALAGAANP